jgi:predicted Zn finger-like uncharacterized protein
MAVSVTCPGCRTSYPVTEDLLGKTIRCKKCQETFTATAAKTAAASRAGDDRIQTRPGARKAAVAPVEDDDDVAPQENGRAAARRPAAKPPQKPGGVAKGALLGAAAGLVILGVGGLAMWALSGDDTPPEPATPSAIGLPVGNVGALAAKANTPPPVQPAVDPAAVAAPTTGTASLSTAEAVPPLRIVEPMARPADFRPEIVEKVKKSTALIRVTVEEGVAYGSGWFAEKHGNEAYIVTNSHVVGMKEPAKPPPEKIEIILSSGIPGEERTLEGKLMGLDREEDLAVIRIKDKDLPDALPIVPSFDLVESQKLLILGYPRGKFLEKELERGLGVKVLTTLKARQTTVAGRIFNKADGSVKYIQVEGGADPGNSGGAVVDTNGNVSAVLVAGDPKGNMRWVIPSEYVIHLLRGRIQKVMPGQAVKSGGIKQPFTALIADPLKRLRQVTADVWAGKPGKVRPAADRRPEAQEGDTPHATVSLTPDATKLPALGENQIARGELNLPPLAEGQVYWFRPHYVAKDGKERWGEAIVLEMGRYPVDAKPANLAIKHKADLRPDDVRRVELESRQAYGFEIEGIGGSSGDQGVKAELTERTLAVDKAGDADVRLKYLDLHLSDDDLDSMFRKQLRGVMDQVKNLAFKVKVTKDGRFRSPVPEWPLVAVGARPTLRRFNEQVIESLEAMSLSLPNKEMQPGQTWGHDSHETIFVTLGGKQTTQNALFRLTCKYVGTRVRDGREEAVVELDGRVVKGEDRPRDGSPGSPGDGIGGGDGDRGGRGGPGGGTGNNDSPTDEDGRLKNGVYGYTRGAALVDVATGHVTLARTESDMAVIFPLAVRNPQTNQEITIRIHAGLYMDLLLRRSLTKDAPKAAEVTALLPNQARAYNPLVGVGAPVASAAPTSIIPSLNTAMPREVFDKVKKATVLVSAEFGDGSTQEGSGWFAEPGLVVTNCHVLGVLSKTSRPPQKITVVLDVGTESQQKLTGKLLTLDRGEDLAVIRVEGGNLPEPIKVVPAADLVETSRLTVLGFPDGTNLRKLLEQGLGNRDLQTTLKARDTTVAGRVPNKDGTVKYVQIEGGADAKGNSGSPVVDGKGNVRAVLVAQMSNNAGVNTMRFVVPGEYAARLIQGYPLEVEPGRAYLDGSTAKQPITVHFGDPMKRVKKVAIDYWVGNPGKPRKPTDKAPKTAPGDGTRQTAELAYDAEKQTATGELALPSRAEGQVYWLQVRFTNGTDKDQWAGATEYAPDGPPVERRPIPLVVKYAFNTQRDLELIAYSHFHYFLFDTEYHRGNPLKVELTERVLQTKAKGATAMLHLIYKDLEWDLKKVMPVLEEVPQLESELKRLLRPFLSLIRGVTTVVTVDKAGHMKLVSLNYARLPLQGQYLMAAFNDQILSALQALTFPLPNREVPYGHTWEFPTNLFVGTRNRRDATLFTMKFKYVGVRDRGGRQEAVIEIEGNLAKDPNAKSLDEHELKSKQGTPPPPPPPTEEPAAPNAAAGFRAGAGAPAPPDKGRKGLYGVARGHAYVDVAGGYVAEVKLFIDMDAEMTAKDPVSRADVPVVSGGTMELLLKRMTAPGKPGT